MNLAPLTRHHAGTVLVWILEQAARNDRSVICTQRDTIGRDCGIPRLRTISQALAVLEDFGIIRHRARARVNQAGETRGRYLQISLRRSTNLSLCTFAFPLRRSTKSVPSVDNASLRRSTKSVPSSLRESGGASATASPAPATATEPTRRVRSHEEIYGNGKRPGVTP